MKLSIGIVGLPNVGKSTLFKILTKQDITIANYPFATIDPNVGVVTVPDERVDKLAALSKSRKKIPAVVEFYDIAGLVKGANKGEGLGNQFLAHIRERKRSSSSSAFSKTMTSSTSKIPSTPFATSTSS